MNLYVAAIAASGKGIADIEIFFRCLPPSTEVCFVVVAHLPRQPESKLANIIARNTRMPVQRVTQNTRLEAGNIYVLTEDSSLSICNGHLIVHQRPQHHNINTSIDELLISMAKDVQNKAICVFLGGMGQDGLAGAKAIERCGGYVITMKPDYTRATEMAQTILEEDKPDAILPLEEIVAHLQNYVSNERHK